MSQIVNVEDFIESLTEEQKECVYWIVGNAAKLRDRQKYYDVYMTLTEAQKKDLWGCCEPCYGDFKRSMVEVNGWQMKIDGRTYTRCDACGRYKIGFDKSGGDFMTVRTHLVSDKSAVVDYLFCADCAKKFDKMMEAFCDA